MPGIPSSLSRDEETIVNELMAAHGYESLTQTQAEALEDGILEDSNWVLVAETGNGKTLVGECRISKALSNNQRVSYLVPSHRLREETVEDLDLWVDDDLMVTMDTRKAENADVVVRTFDSFFRSALADPTRLNTLDLVILDDFHEIYSSSRGPGIEKAIAALRESDITLVAMSATIGNPDHVAQWLDAELTISSERRGVPIEEVPIAIDDSYRRRGDQIANVVSENYEKRPFLVFCNSRRNCESRAEAIAEAGVVESQYIDRDIEADIDSLLQTNLTKRYRSLIDLLESGVAYHHAGLPRPVQDYITELIHDGIATVVCCTPTLAYGFDAPIQSVIVSDLKRWTGERMSYVAMYEYIQWIGRAGRPGYGYDRGYAFPMYKSFNEADDRFQFDRPTTEKSLEPVTTHLDESNELRVLLLELIGSGWNTQTEIESFLRSTFYWSQLHISTNKLSSWGMDRSGPGERITKELGTQASWLINRELLEQRADNSFELTALGDAMVGFVHDTWGQYTITHILSLLDWLRSRDAYDVYDLLEILVDTFNKTVDETTSSQKFVSKLTSHSLGNDEVGHTVGLLTWYWCEGAQLDDIEAELDIDPTTLPRIAYQLADLLDSMSRFFDPLGKSPPDWYETLRLQLKYGVSAETITLVESVEGIGRVRVMSLQEGLDTLELDRDEDYGEGSLLNRLSVFKEEALNDDSTLFIDVLGSRSTFEGIGPTLAKRIEQTLTEVSHSNRNSPFN